jgi:muramoyltetrapeptide carboxypeptidase
MEQNKKNLFGQIRTVGIAAPAGPAGKNTISAGIRCLHAAGLNTITGKHLFSGGNFPYLSADDDARAEDFNSLIADERVDAILCTRGGYGTPRILGKINYDLLRERNIPVIGFSDITALHLAMYSGNAGICIASQMAARLPDALHCRKTADGIRRVYAMLSAQEGTFRKTGTLLKPLSRSPEFISGKVIPLNLTLAAALCGTEYLPSMQGNVIILEEIGEPVRKIDRMLQQLFMSGFFNGAEAVIFAQFTDCENSRLQMNLFRDFAANVSCPVYCGFPYGHDLPSVSFRFGEPCRIAGREFQVLY